LNCFIWNKYRKNRFPELKHKLEAYTTLKSGIEIL